MNYNNTENISRLLRKHFTGITTPEEEKVLEAWLAEDKENRERYELWKRDDVFSREHRLFCTIDYHAAWERFRTRQGLHAKRRRVTWIKYASAAAIVILMVSGGLWWKLSSSHQENVVQTIPSIPKHPNPPSAVLQLADGIRMELSQGKEQEIVIGDQTAIKQESGTLIYPEGKVAETVDTNTLMVPPGGEFELQLSDGTKIYLNSATTLRYPVRFNEESRTVYLQGEAYFDVAKDSSRPFIVITEDIQAQVYGTEFNINTRGKEVVRTVLVNGSIGVRVKGEKKEYLLRPSEMASFNRRSKHIEVKKVNPGLYTLWRKGIFVFERESLEDIMITLSSWYDMEVVFLSEKAKRLHFSGHMRRYEDIRDILHALSDATGVQFSIQEKTIIVSQ